VAPAPASGALHQAAPIISAVSERKAGNKVSHSLVALSSATILAVYGAGYLRTKAAADRFERQAAERRPAVPAPGAALSFEEPVPGRAEPPPAARRLSEAAGPDTATETAPRAEDGSASASRASVAGERMPASTAGPGVVPAGVTRTDGATTDAGTQQAEAPVREPSPALSATGVTPVAAEPASTSQALPAPPAPRKGEYVDGTYLGWGSCRHGDIQASVLVEGGRVTTTTIAQCLTRYTCDWITPLLPQVAARQRAEVDYVSGATESSYAFADAVADALSKAK
jgi:uncharacterized protein with FMN-binding domain